MDTKTLLVCPQLFTIHCFEGFRCLKKAVTDDAHIGSVQSGIIRMLSSVEIFLALLYGIINCDLKVVHNRQRFPFSPPFIILGLIHESIVSFL